MDEEEIREEIARMLCDKSSVIHDLSGVKGNDFTFVKSANKKADGDSPLILRESAARTPMVPSMPI